MFLSWTVSAAADLLSCLPAFQTELADGQWVAIVIFATHPLAWLECVRHLGLPQNAVGFELTSQDSIQEPRWPWGCVCGGRGFRYRQRTWGRKRLPHQEGITLPSTPTPTPSRRHQVASVVSDSATPWTAAYQASPSMGFSRQEHWSGLPFPSPTPSQHPQFLHTGLSTARREQPQPQLNQNVCSFP